MGKKKISSSIQERRKKRLNTVPLVSRNRFEVHVNRSKHNILGRKEKHDRGVPGISRSKANEKRKKTLLVRYKQRNKSNVIIDKRFGEFDETVSAEEKMLKRFTLEKQSHHVKVGHYNIEEDEELTHYGQNLADISNLDELELGEEDDGYDNGDMFGGLLMKKKKEHQSEDGRDGRTLTRQEIMQEIIVDSKRDKHERQKTKQLSFELTQKLDTEWKQIHSMLTKRSEHKSTATVKEKQDDYDKIVNELLFEAKGTKPTERLKSVEEIAKEEKRKQAKMEKQRIDRMEMVDEDESVHQSADALIVKLPKKTEERFMLQFRDGEMIKPEGYVEKNDEIVNNSDNDDDNNDDNDEEDQEEDTDEDDDTDNEDVFSDEEAVDNDLNSMEDEEIDGEDKVEGNGMEISVEGSRKIKINKNKSKMVTKKTKKCKPKETNTETDKPLYNFEVPDNVDSLLDVIRITKLDISVLLPKIRRINIGNKKNLEKLFNIILEYMEHTCNQPQPSMQCLNNLGGFIQELVHDIPLHVTKAIQLKLSGMFKRIMVCAKNKRYPEMFPTLSELTLFKIVELLFPTSDLNHVITTPCLYIIALVFTKARFTTIKCILSGLLLLDGVYNYVKLSKRYLPEMIGFLTRLFYQAVPVDLPLKKITSSVLNTNNYESGFLYVSSDKHDVRLCGINISLLSPSCGEDSLENDSFRLSSIRNMLLLTKKFCNLYIEMETFNEIFEPVLFLVEMLPADNYPTSMNDLHQSLLTLMKSKSSDEKAPLKLQTRKPIPLTMLEPQFEESNGNMFNKHGGDNKAKNEHDKLKYKVKKELKGAVREIRKDTHYLAKQQLGEKLVKDATRKRKVKELKSALENESREIREMEKGSKSKK